MDYVRFTLRINKEILDELSKLAKEKCISRNALINLILQDFILSKRI